MCTVVGGKPDLFLHKCFLVIVKRLRKPGISKHQIRSHYLTLQKFITGTYFLLRILWDDSLCNCTVHFKQLQRSRFLNPDQVLSLKSLFIIGKCFFHTLCESYCFTPPLKDKPVIPGLLFQVPLSV